MKTLAALLLSFIVASAHAGEFAAPVHSAESILSAILEKAKLARREIKVVVMTYDYVNEMWHVELSTSDQRCIDCFPSFFIKNGEQIVVEQLPHG
jgi:hypothetical protein